VKKSTFYAASGNEPRPLINRSGFVRHANKLLFSRQHPPV